MLFLINCGALFFLLYKAAIRGYHWQVKYFRAAMSETTRYFLHPSCRDRSVGVRDGGAVVCKSIKICPTSFT